MKKLLSLSLLIITSLHTMSVILPEAERLKRRLGLANFDHLADYTSIVDDLAGKQLETQKIVDSVDAALSAYKQLFNPALVMLTVRRRPQLLQCILEDYPEVFATLIKK